MHLLNTCNTQLHELRTQYLQSQPEAGANVAMRRSPFLPVLTDDPC